MILHSGSCIVYKEAHVHTAILVHVWQDSGPMAHCSFLIAKNTRKKFIAKSFVRMKFKDLK